MILKSDHFIVVIMIMSKFHVSETFNGSFIRHYDMLFMTIGLPFSLLLCIIIIRFNYHPYWA